MKSLLRFTKKIYRTKKSTFYKAAKEVGKNIVIADWMSTMSLWDKGSEVYYVIVLKCCIVLSMDGPHYHCDRCGWIK